MPQNYKVLGQVLPAANTITNVYVTGASTSAVINSIYFDIC
jgi:2',3'-cyclic-nucleotide 2'-phosphodiesterase (5'-nucleotidase family)